DPSGYTFWANFAEADVPEVRQPMVTGLQFRAASSVASGPQGEFDITRVHTVPDPYYVRSQFELGPSNKALRFVNVPPQSIIRIYSLNGTLVRVLEFNDPLGGAEATWDLRNRNNQFVASGVYFYVVEGANGKKFTGKFTVVQFAR
ncbi:MAG TPA: T9SS type A sorting domain-containing protein, partial [Longimicrobiales bacterium]